MIENVCGIKVGQDHARYLEVLEPGRRTRSWSASRNEGTWLENMREHGQRVFMSSAAPYLYQAPGWRPMREYTELAAGRGDFGAAEVADTLDPVRGGGGQVAAGRAGAHGRPAGLDQGLGRAGRHVRRPGAAAAAAAAPRPSVADLAADLDAVGLLPGSGGSARVLRNGHRAARR